MSYYDTSYPPSLWTDTTPPVVNATGAIAGAPGSWVPAGSVPPANVAGAAGLTAAPSTPWTVGQYVQTGTAGAAGETYWNGTAYVAGRAPAAMGASTPVEEP